MSYAEIMDRAKRFKDMDVRKMYVCVAMANEWVKETGGTLDDFLREMEANCEKRGLI